MDEVTITIGEKELILTEKDIKEILFCLRSQISWKEGGCYGDGDKVIDNPGMKRAQMIATEFKDWFNL